MRRRYEQERYRDQVARDPENRRWMHMKHRYGLDQDGFAGLAEVQGGCCYLCGEPLDLDNPTKIHVDHDHLCCRGKRSCGQCVRGLACDPCNRGIGHFGDDPERMRRAADNLEMANRQLRSARGG
jgi:hypothetical protein